MTGIPEAVDKYYEAWTAKAGDMTDVPLGSAFVFESPLGVLPDQKAFHEMAGQFGAAAVNFQVREQYVAGRRVCSIVQWELPAVDGVTVAAEIVSVDATGALEKVELIYDPKLVNQFMHSLDFA